MKQDFALISLTFFTAIMAAVKLAVGPFDWVVLMLMVGTATITGASVAYVVQQLRKK